MKTDIPDPQEMDKLVLTFKRFQGIFFQSRFSVKMITLVFDQSV